MAHITYAVTCTLSDFDGSPLPFAPIVIRHVGAGLGALGTVADGYKNAVTDLTGTAVFQLVSNTGDYLGTHYEITSYHPTTGARIHKGAAFIVPESDADVDVLIESSIVVTDPTPAVVAQLNAALATATAAAVSAQGAIASTTAAASTATIKAAEAVAAATTATTKATEATTGATTATTAATTATTKAGEAVAAAASVTTSATTATTKAAESVAAANSAATAEVNTVAARNTATAAATTATTAATTATTKATEATTAAAGAATSEANALSSRNTANTAATTATSSATTATTAATTATNAATTATTGANTATTKATEASASAAAAALSAASAAAGTVNNINGKTPVAGVVTLVPADLGAQPVDAKITSFSSVSSAVTGFIRIANAVVSVDSASYLTGNQNITITGDGTGSGATAITFTLANSGVTAGTYNNSATQVRPFTVDAKGRVTSIGGAVTIAPAFSSITGRPTTLAGYGITDAATAAQGALAASAVQPGSVHLTRIRTLALAGL